MLQQHQTAATLDDTHTQLNVYDTAAVVGVGVAPGDIVAPSGVGADGALLDAVRETVLSRV